MLGAARLFSYRQCALLEWSRRCKVALFLEHEGEVVEALCGVGMLGTERLFSYRHCIANKLRGLRVGRAPERITRCPVQKRGPICNVRIGIGIVRSGIRASIAQRQQMRGKLSAQWP